MKLLPSERAIPAWVRNLPVFRRYRGFLLLGTVYLREDIYRDLLTDTPAPESVSVLVHERTHYLRASVQGPLRFGAGYLFSAETRFREELAAMRVQFAILRRYHRPVGEERYARALSGPLYLWCTTYPRALLILQQLGRGASI